MIIEINYTALHWDNHQGGSGRPFAGRLLREVRSETALAELHTVAVEKLELERARNKNLIGDYRLVNIVIDV